MIKKTLRKILPVSIKNQIGMILEMAIKKRIIKRNYSGFPLFVHLEDRTGYEWYNNDWDLLPEIELLKKGKLCSGAKVFDCGAHQGILASILANITSEKGQVIAVEANPHNFDLAVKNRDINALSQLEIINKAVGEKEGEVSFINRSNGRIKLKNINEKGIKIPCTTVDQLSKEFGTPDVIFIDVEGVRG
jgi:FkbM family methyltransferase